MSSKEFEKIPKIFKLTSNAADKLEILQMVLIAQLRVGINLQRIIVHGRVLEQAIVRVEHFLAQQVEPLLN